MAIFYEKARKSRHFAKKKRINVAKFWVVPLRWNPIYHGKKAEPRNSGLCPFEGRNPFYPGIFFASAIKKNSRICLKSVFPVILITLRSFSVLKGGTHSILAKRRNWENSEFKRFLSPLDFYPEGAHLLGHRFGAMGHFWGLSFIFHRATPSNFIPTLGRRPSKVMSIACMTYFSLSLKIFTKREKHKAVIFVSKMTPPS